MSRARWTWLTLTLVLVALIAACDGSLPRVRGFGSVVPHLEPPSNIHARGIPSLASKALEDGQASSGSCQGWETEHESYDRSSGAFEYHYSCAEGGDVASIRTVGVDNHDGSGQYTTTYTLRDGSVVIWEFDYLPDPVMDDTVHYYGTSNHGGSFEAEYRDEPNGYTSQREVYRYSDREIVVEGYRDSAGRFNGSVVFDVLATEVSPDWTLVHEERIDGSVRQTIHSIEDGWDLREQLSVDAAGEFDYAFKYDDLATDVAPDYQGAYRYGPDGEGQGSYRQTSEDRSVLDVEQWIAPDGTYRETWIFDDALTAPSVEQEGELSYDLGGHGTGSLTTYVVDGGAEVCDLEVYADGSTVIDNCR